MQPSNLRGTTTLPSNTPSFIPTASPSFYPSTYPSPTLIPNSDIKYQNASLNQIFSKDVVTILIVFASLIGTTSLILLMCRQTANNHMRAKPLKYKQVAPLLRDGNPQPTDNSISIIEEKYSENDGSSVFNTIISELSQHSDQGGSSVFDTIISELSQPSEFGISVGEGYVEG